MGNDNYGAALLAMATRQDAAAAYCNHLSRTPWAEWPREGFFGRWHALAGDVSRPSGSKLDKAIAYLRERKLYALDIKQPRIPPKERPQTVLDKWIKERHK